jgi:antitoxin VapB
VSLNIKNERVHALAREVAARTGKSQTSAIEEALREYLEQLDRTESKDAKWARAEAILADMRARLAAIPGGLDLSTDFLYDEDGLPR